MRLMGWAWRAGTRATTTGAGARRKNTSTVGARTTAAVADGEKNGDDGWRWALMAQPVYMFLRL